MKKSHSNINIDLKNQDAIIKIVDDRQLHHCNICLGKLNTRCSDLEQAQNTTKSEYLDELKKVYLSFTKVVLFGITIGVISGLTSRFINIPLDSWKYFFKAIPLFASTIS